MINIRALKYTVRYRNNRSEDALYKYNLERKEIENKLNKNNMNNNNAINKLNRNFNVEWNINELIQKRKIKISKYEQKLKTKIKNI